MVPVPLLNRFNESIHQWMAYLDDYSFEELLRQPSDQSWSLGQVYMHLIEATKFFVSQMRQALVAEPNEQEEVTRNGKALFLSNEFPDMLIEGPPENAYTRQPKSKAEILQGLTAIENDVNHFCLTFDVEAAPGRTKHPGLGYFSAQEWLQFLEMHLRHHLRQKARIDAARNSS